MFELLGYDPVGVEIVVVSLATKVTVLLAAVHVTV